MLKQSDYADIVRKWIDYFVYNIEVSPEKITKKYNTMVVSILKAEYIEEYKIKFVFSDPRLAKLSTLLTFCMRLRTQWQKISR